jgi:D-alanyl-D-alanine dipeptidase
MMTSRMLRIAAALATAALTGCAAAATHKYVTVETACGQRAVQIIAQNVGAISSHRYAQASIAAERAARISLACAVTEPASAQFSDRWRGANALVVAAELAHQAAQPNRAKRLLAEGYGIMHQLRPPAHVSALTSTLIAQTRDGAERDLRGQWSYW